jgi:hypothetical protein
MKSLVLSVIVLTGVVLAPLAFAVERNVPGEYATIQAAINASSAGDVVIIAPGTYTGVGNKDLVFAGRAITVRSTAPTDSAVVAATVIDCESSGRGFCFYSGEGSNSIVSGITIKRGRVGNQGGGIYCGSSSPTIKNCVINNNTAFGSSGAGNGQSAYGGGVFCTANSHLTLIDCTVSNNNAQGGNGEDVWCSPMSGCYGSLGNGGSAYGGGIFCSSGSSITVTGCIITNNSVLGGQGGIFYDTGSPTGGALDGTANGGGIAADGTITNCLIANNLANMGSGFLPVAPPEGGGILTDNSYISNCTITGNTCVANNGSGIQGTGSTVIVNCIIWNNSDDDLSNCSATYSCISNTDDSGTGVIHSAPWFVNGPLGNYYLRQVAAGQSSNSPCVNAGSDTSIHLGMNLTTTRTDKMVDTGIVDMGYHYPTGYGSPDLNRDAFVDFIDFAVLAKDWLQTPDPCDPNNGDITKNGWVDFYDLAQLASNWLTCFVTKATAPVPADHAADMSRNVILQWSPGDNVVSHDIYFGTDFNAVTNASIDSPAVYMGNQDVNYWDINDYNADGLQYGRTYYWRIDEVAGCTAKGDVWSFTINSRDINLGLADWWKFDEGTGTIAYDSAGTNNGTISGATWTTGHVNGALSFNGSSNYVNCGSGASNYDNITVSVWMQTSTNRVLVSNRYNTGYGTWYTLSSSTIEIGDNASGGYKYLTFNTPTLNGLWHHVVYTKNGTSHAIYVDGNLDQSFTSNADISVNQTLFIGKSNMSNSWFNGIIDDVRIYNRASLAEEVLQLYNYSLSESHKAFWPNPANGTANVGLTTDLSWTAGSGATTHDVYFGTINPPPFRINQTGTTYDTGTMDTNTTYYWRIDEKNSIGTTTGNVWNFTTVPPLPGQASNQTPGNGATDVSITTDLSWTAGGYATSHDVYFGTTNPPPFRVNQTGTTYDTGTMAISTTYYWRIDEKNASGTTTGDVWSFTTIAQPPGQASNPTPSNGVAGVSITTDISWTAGNNTTSHDVYFGTTNPPPFIGNQTSTTYDTGTMDINTTYYWRIDEKNVNGTTIGDIWNFKTKISPNVNNVPSEYSTIQAAINAAGSGDTVVIAPGTYTGPGNKDLDFAGKAITVRSADPNDPDVVAATVINCEGSSSNPHRGFYFHSGEGVNSIIMGLSITNGYGPNANISGYGDQSVGGGIFCNNNSGPTILKCKINGNTARHGGGICCYGTSSPTISHCIITGNNTFNYGLGAGINCMGGSATVEHCVIYGNTCTSTGGLFCSRSCNITISHSIVWNNSSPFQLNVGTEGDSDHSHLTVSYSDIMGGQAGAGVSLGRLATLTWGTGNINSDPFFVYPGNGNYHLSASSPCIDAGDPSYISGGETDIDGDARVLNGRIDIGADEFH